jgi:hypothetical protein
MDRMSLGAVSLVNIRQIPNQLDTLLSAKHPPNIERG